jgi:hypothetical protein
MHNYALAFGLTANGIVAERQNELAWQGIFESKLEKRSTWLQGNFHVVFAGAGRVAVDS